MSEETIVAVFDTASHADAAVADLKAARVPDSAISRHEQGSQAATTGGAMSTTARPAQEQGFWSSLFGGSSADEQVYDHSMASGGSVVVVKAPTEDADSVISILEKHSPVDLDERAASTGLGATSTTGAATGMGGAAAGLTGSTMARTGTATGMTGATTPGMTSTTTTTTAPLAGTMTTGTAAQTAAGGVMQLSEESLAVGKRLVNRGGTRIRRYVVERPAEADVSLRSETVQVERRPVTGAEGRTADFSEKTIEMTATGEEAVVGKTARVVEEVALRKEATERTETVHDTVRREEVEVEQIPATGTTATPLNTTPKR